MRKITKTRFFFIPKCAMTRELLRIPDFVEGCVVEHALCAAVSAAAAVPTAAAVRT